MTNIAGSVILVIGASGGLGSLIAGRLEAGGATVVRASRTPSADGLTVELRSAESASGIIAAAVQRAGKLDGVVLAAGVVAFGPAADVTDATIDELVLSNMVGQLRVIRDAAGPLAESAAAGRDPFIVTLSGVVAEMPTAGLAAYSAAKAGLAAFMVAASREYRRGGIRLLDARPGHIATELSQHPIAGTAPAFGAALVPDAVAARIVEAIVSGEKDLPSSAFQA
jgi:NAD(P)-dependent dehydrogenase (short-subunit alcohol dehydrogenase family)